MDSIRRLAPFVAVASTVLTLLPLAFAPPALTPIQWTVTWAVVAILSLAALWWNEREAHATTKKARQVALADVARLHAQLDTREVDARYRKQARAEIAGIIDRGVGLREELLGDYQSGTVEEWGDRAQAWYEDAQKVVLKYESSFHATFIRDTPLTGIIRSLPAWAQPLVHLLDTRLGRLEEMRLRLVASQ